VLSIHQVHEGVEGGGGPGNSDAGRVERRERPDDLRQHRGHLRVASRVRKIASTIKENNKKFIYVSFVEQFTHYPKFEGSNLDSSQWFLEREYSEK
jgi:hypothetical protein